MLSKRLIVALVVLACAGGARSGAQMRVLPVDEQRGHVALGLALRHLANTGVFMMATAHPDDENNALLVMLNRGQGYRTALATATRGNGGQNEIGPEIFEALGVLRTEELAAIHRFDGAEQYFTRAVDFGFSFSVEETFEKWGRDEILADYVRLIRTVRPDVITGLSPEGDGGGQHHQASAILAREAFKAAADATKFPEQIQAGLRPWQAKKFFFTGGARPNGAAGGRSVTIQLAGYDNLLGRTYAEIGSEARSMHKCQGTGQLLSLPGPSTATYQLVESVLPAAQREDTSLFDGIDTSIAGLARFAGNRPPRELNDGLKNITTAILDAQKRYDTETDDATVLPLLTGLRAVRALRGQLRGMNLDEAGRFEIDLRLRQKEREFQEAVLAAASVRVDALADDGVVIPGQDVRVQVIVANRGAADVTVTQVSFAGFDGDTSCTLNAVTSVTGFGVRGRGAAPAAASPLSMLKRNQTTQCTPTLKVPADAQVSEPYWHRAGEDGRYTFDDDAPFGLPYRPTAFYVQATLTFAGSEEVFSGVPVQYRYEGNIFSGEKRSELLVVPALSVRVSPQVAILPVTAALPPSAAPAPATGRGRGTAPPASPAQGRGRGAAARPAAPPPPPPPSPAREIRVTVVNDGKAGSESVVRLELPAGWTSTPPEQTVVLTREDESRTVRFQVRSAPDASPGAFSVKASARSGDTSYARGFQVIEYPHVRRQHIYDPAETTVKVIDVKTALNLTVGYVMGVGDAVPAAIEQLGVKVEQLTAEDLAWGDLSRFQTIVTGVRAYERRADLRANNSRLIDYVREGGTLIVQYNKFEFNEAQYGPWTAEVSNNRVTDERAPVTVLLPTDPLLNVPNKITESAWSGWVQERGLYFLGEKDSRYRDVIELADPFPNNPGEKRGALVTATYGRGRWVYVGLGLWRELPAGVDGAYPLLANLISLNH